MLPAVLIAVATVLVLGLLPFLALRSYARRVERSGSDEADKVHRLRRVALGGVFVGALVVSAVWGAFLASAVDTGPGRGVFLVGMLLSLVAMSLGVSLGVGPAYRRIRGIHQSAGERFRKGLRVSLVFLIPMGLWFGIRLGFGSVFEEQPILRLMGWIVFVILFTATTPFLIVWLVPGRPPPGDLAARIATLAGRLP
jgi:hypothetical protein